MCCWSHRPYCLLLRWSADPPITACLVLGGYALAFGNHLSMVLLLPAYALFLFASAPAGGVHSSQYVIFAAVAGRRSGALLLVETFSPLWREVVPPAGFAGRPADLLVRCPKTGWPRDDGSRGAGCRDERTAAHVCVRSRAAVRMGAAPGGLAEARAPGADELAARSATRHESFARPSTFALGYNVGDAPYFFCLLISSLLFWYLLASSPGDVPSARAIPAHCPGRVPGAGLVEHHAQLSSAGQERRSEADRSSLR